VTELWLKPNYGSYEPGERAIFMLQGQRIQEARKPHNQAEPAEWTFKLRVLRSNESAVANSNPVFEYGSDRFTEIWKTEQPVAIGRELTIQRIPMPITLAAGYYAVECEAVSPSGERRILRQGFWG
ncbi:glycoside hydrolase, partial [Paenibacillus sepulcri]|nr:glycoside hydrolase [Paenibacillus sepulcri]